jgi:hypothetical protein
VFSVFRIQFSVFRETAGSGEHGTANSLHGGEGSIEILHFAQDDTLSKG